MIRRLLQMAEVVVDVTLRLPSLPVRGGDVLARSWTTVAGGGFNAMAAARRSGLAVAYGGGLGGGPYGAIARAAIEAEGIEILRAAPSEADQSCCLVLVEKDGERSFVSGPGRPETRTADLARIAPGAGDAVLIDGYGLTYTENRGPLLDWLERLPPATPVAFDPASAVARIPPEALARALDRTTWLSLNREEAAAIVGSAAPEIAAQALLEDHCPRAEAVILRLGAEGCLAAARGAAPVLAPGLRVEAVDTTGAGDAHIGAFLAALAAEDGDPVAAARYANAAAALAVTREGPAAAPSRAEVEGFMRRATPR